MSDDLGSKAERATVRRVQGSGAWLGAKGDFRTTDFLIEQKATEKNSIGVKLEVLRKIGHEARAVGLRPACTIVFTDSTGRPRHDGAWVMVRERDWEEMTSVSDEEQPAPEG